MPECCAEAGGPIPRKHSLDLLIALDFHEVKDGAGFAQDTADRVFVMNARHQGGVLVTLNKAAQIARALALINQAHALMAGA